MNFGEINGMSKDKNNSSFNPGSNKSFPDFRDPLADFHKYVQGLQTHLNEKDMTIKRLQSTIERLENEKKMGYNSTTHKYSNSSYDYRSRETEFRRAIDRAVDSLLGGGVGEHTTNRPHPQWQKNNIPVQQVTSPLTTQSSTPDRSTDENSTSAANSKNYDSAPFESSFPPFQPSNESELAQDTPEESSRDQQNYSNNNSSTINSVSNHNVSNGIDEVKSSTSTSTAVTPTGTSMSPMGTMQPQVLRSLFPEDDVREIRQSPNKSFAHIDFNSLDALNRALKKHGIVMIS
ncbi:4472_t:CDS:2 [Ambispora gerdemannii]|uniref:4472_t:CDS:1 n=1 Tax=Ambispora gerdemannii TaxID=144530 RepID=A0A9N9B498_9GLOM|nr:4472_t:CDS:2 [Ambispora gerdemannii]